MSNMVKVVISLLNAWFIAYLAPGTQPVYVYFLTYLTLSVK